MTTGTKIALGIAIAVTLGVGGFYAFKGGEQSVPNTEGAATTNTSGKKMAFVDFMRNDTGSYKCTVYRSEASQGSSTGTIYLANKMIRGEFVNSYQGQNIDARFIIRDGYAYTWAVMNAQNTSGVKIKIPVDTEGSPEGETLYKYADSVGDYNCENWNADASMFTVPTNITFQAIN
jgi:hypothetical protein